MKTLVFLALLLLAAGGVQAQNETTLFLRDGRDVSGSLTGVSEDSLFLVQPYIGHHDRRADTAPITAYARLDVRKVEIGSGSGTSILGSTLIGLGIGTVAGAMLAATVDDDEFMAEFNQMVALTIGIGGGLLGGLIVGLEAESDDEVFYPMIDADFEALRRYYDGSSYPSIDWLADSDTSFSIQPDIIPENRVKKMAMKAVEPVQFTMKDGTEFIARPICANSSTVKILPEVGYSITYGFEGPFALVPTRAISSVKTTSSGTLVIGMLAGALAGPIVIQTPDDTPQAVVLAKIGAGALAGAGIAWLISRYGSVSWEWHAGSSIEILQEHALYRQCPESISVKQHNKE